MAPALLLPAKDRATDRSAPPPGSAEILRDPKYIRGPALSLLMGHEPDAGHLSGESLPRLDERVRGLLAEIPGAVAFQGLRRTLGVHPESLTRALRRLERDGEIQRTNEGYRLVGAASSIPGASTPSLAVAAHGPLSTTETRARSKSDAGRDPWVHPSSPRWEGAPRVELRLAPDEDPARILGHLAGRWFGEFRWVGSYEEGARTTLLWVSRQGRELLGLVLEGGRLRIHQQSPGPAVGSDRSLASYELLQHVLSALRAPRSEPDGLPRALPLLMGDPAGQRHLPRAS